MDMAAGNVANFQLQSLSQKELNHMCFFYHFSSTLINRLTCFE